MTEQEFKNLQVPVEEIDKLIAYLRDFVKDTFRKPQRSLTPQLLTLVRTWPDCDLGLRIYIIDRNFNEPEEKHSILRQIGRKIYDAQEIPVAAALLSECWLSEQTAGKAFLRPRDDPQRIEGLNIAACTLDRRHQAHTFLKVRRDRKNRMVLHGNWSEVVRDVNAMLLSSLFMGFMDRTVALRAERN